MKQQLHAFTDAAPPNFLEKFPICWKRVLLIYILYQNNVLKYPPYNATVADPDF